MTTPLPPPTRYTDRTAGGVQELREMAQDNADLHGWTVEITVEPQPGGLFSVFVVFSAGAAEPVAVAQGALAVAAAPAEPAAVATPASMAAAAVKDVAIALPAEWKFSAGGQPLTQAAFDRAIAELGGLDPALLWALIKKEAPGASGFMSDRRPFILYERHVFSRNSGSKFDAEHPDLSARHKPYVAGAPGPDGYGSYPQQYERLAQAMALDADAALMACSWGIGQTLGEEFADLGYSSAVEMVHRMIGSEDEQLVGVVREIQHKKAAGLLAGQDFKGFALLYNGAGAPASYWTELEANFVAFKTNGLPDLGVRRAQLLLAYLGFLTGSGVDGVIGPATRKALAKFQAANGMAVSSEADSATMAALDQRVFSGSIPVMSVRAACVKNFDSHKGDCSGFARAVAADVGAELTGQADAIVEALRGGGKWMKLVDGQAAAARARLGDFVVAGLKGGEQAVVNAHGHVVVVVDGDLAFAKYPSAYWGSLGGTPGFDKTLNFAWETRDRDRVTYAAWSAG